MTLRVPLPVFIAALAATAATTTVIFTTVLPSILIRKKARVRKSLRSSLPRTIEEWSLPGGDETFADPLWKKLQNFFEERGYFLWRPIGLTYLAPPLDIEATCNGFASAPLHRGWDAESRVAELNRIDCPNAMLRAARTADGRDVVIRVVCVGNEGQNHVKVLKHLARGWFSQATPNHAVPLFELIELEDITFAILPRVGFSMIEMIFSDMQNSVGDFLDMIMQCLEALAFIHTMDVAHRDAFKDNFLIQWFPESLAEKQLTISRPRVFLNDFETAVLFDEGTPKDQQTCVGLPLAPSFAIPERYFRPYPKEVSSGEPYNPYKLDVWQFGTSLSDFKTTIPEIDTLLSSMTKEDPQMRPNPYTILTELAQIVHSMPPDSLKIALTRS